MTRWNVYATVTGAKYLGCFEAKTAAEAEAIALKKKGDVTLCQQCSDLIENRLFRFAAIRAGEICDVHATVNWEDGKKQPR